MESQADYRISPPLLRPLNDAEHRETKQLNDALTQAKIALGDRHAELRMMRVAVDELTKRALKAEARVKEQQAERDELKDLVGMQSAKIADLYKRNAILADDNTSFEKENTAVRERLADALARVKEQQAELGEQERDKLALLVELSSR